MNRVLERIARIFDIAASFALAGVIVWLGYMNFYREIDSVLLIFSLVFGGLVASIVCGVFHELGHIVIGAICGFRFNSLHIGPLKIFRDEGNIRCTVKSLPDSLAGSAEMLPTNAANLYEKYLAMVCGGLAFSLLFLAADILVLNFYKSIPFAVYALVCTSLPYAFHLFFYNVLPFNDDNLDTDGGMLKGLLKKEPSYLTAVNILAIEAYLYQGLTPAEIDKDLYFGAPQLPEDDLNFVLLTNYRLNYYIDAGDTENALKASARLESVAEYIPKIYKSEILADVLFCECCISGNTDKAKKMYPSLKLYLKGENSLQSHRIAAAYELYANSDKMAALRELNAAEQKAENYYIKGIEKYERKLLACIRGDIKTDIYLDGEK